MEKDRQGWGKDRERGKGKDRFRVREGRVESIWG